MKTSGIGQSGVGEFGVGDGSDMVSTITGRQPVEYVEEPTFTESVSDPSMNWIGLVTSYNSETSVDSKVFRQEVSGRNVASGVEARKIRESIGAEIEYVPQDLSLLQYYTGKNGGTDDRLDPIQIGEQMSKIGGEEPERRRLLGCVGEEFDMDIQPDSPINVNASFIVADRERWSRGDYIGGGSHATEDSDAALTYDDVSNISYGGQSLEGVVSDVTLSISNQFEIFTSDKSSINSEIDTIMLREREITVGFTIKYVNSSLMNIVENYDKGVFCIDVGDQDVEVSDVKFPDFEHVAEPGELNGMTVESEPASKISYTTGILVVESGETYTVSSGDTEKYRRAVIDGTLNVDGNLILTGGIQ